MTRGDVVFSLVDYATEFVREYKNSTLEQKAIDAIIGDFLNYFALRQCGMDLAMYTKDLRDGKKMSKEGTILQKDVILRHLNFHKRQYDKSGIVIKTKQPLLQMRQGIFFIIRSILQNMKDNFPLLLKTTILYDTI